MPFKVTARALLQLGSELISNDAIAFYELIKNSVDAGSPKAEVDVVVRVRFDTLALLQHTAASLSDKTAHIDSRLSALTNQLRELVDETAPASERYLARLDEGVTTVDDFRDLLDDANYIQFSDSGSGMTLEDLRDVYLTVGTAHRVRQKAEIGSSTARPLLGEKGIGRLSAMRLGWKLSVRTSTLDEEAWNFLNVDWRDFDRLDDASVESIPIRPHRGASKSSPSLSGTRVRISALTSEWSKTRLEKIAAEELSKFGDPFTQQLYPIILRFNRDLVAIPSLNRLLFQAAHATVRATFKTKPTPVLTGEVDYTLRGQVLEFSLSDEELLSAAGVSSLDVLRNLGPFSVECYWFNRPQMAAIPGLLGRDEVVKLQRQWAGGLMLYRDGFRVFPYGSPDDDWLDLDRKALASPGYKVNRRQLIGRVSISSRLNPALVDQTNREGLRQRPEKDALVFLLKHILEAQFRAFLNKVDRDSALTISTIEKRLARQRADINQVLGQIKSKYPQSAPLLAEVSKSVRRIVSAMRDVKTITNSLEDQRRQLVHLAGVGLMVEVVAHELGRATRQALKALPRISRGGQVGSDSVRTLEQQLKTLEKRLRILDPAASTAHQIKEDFELSSWIEEIFDSHADQFLRHHVTPSISRIPPDRDWRIRAVKGMVVQILENLISNSVYWLDRKRLLVGTAFHPEISVVLDQSASEIRFGDNGPGIRAANRERVFEPFVTSKPPGEGKGLGLYIARELARYNGWDLNLLSDTDEPGHRHATFVLTVSKK